MGVNVGVRPVLIVSFTAWAEPILTKVVPLVPDDLDFRPIATMDVLIVYGRAPGPNPSRVVYCDASYQLACVAGSSHRRTCSATCTFNKYI